MKSLDKLYVAANEQRNVDGFSLIFIAISRNNSHVLKQLLSLKADPLISDKNGHTPLDLALSSIEFEPEIVEELIKASIKRLVNIDRLSESQKIEIQMKEKTLIKFYKESRTWHYDSNLISSLRDKFKYELNTIKEEYHIASLEERIEAELMGLDIIRFE